MWTVFSALLLFFTIITSFWGTLSTSASSALHPDELNALEEIATTLGIKRLNLSYGDPCRLGTLKIIQEVGVVWNPGTNNTIRCNCSFNNYTTCHITDLILRNFTLSGKVPPELAKLRYLRSIDLYRNYLSGAIPMEWASLPYLTYISLSGNRLSGNLPTGIQNFKNLKALFLSSNQFTGGLPSTLARLVNLEEFVVCDNNFTGIIPRYIGNWSRLKELHLCASGLRGPIPDGVARLENLTTLTISDTTGINSFPNISNNAIQTLILRNVGLSGPIPSYIWEMPNLYTLDLSFNKLTGEVQLRTKYIPKYTYLTGNMLSGNIESGVSLDSEPYIDLSYNNFSWSSSCQEKSNVNTYRSSYLKNSLAGLLPCAGPISCTNYQRSLHINCGGESVTITNSLGKITYQADNSNTNAATNQHFENWGISNTGHFTNATGDAYIISTSLIPSGDSLDLYKTARRSALSLVYYAFCLENGAYNVNLHFMEIQFSDKELYSRLGRRIFEVYVQGELFLRDFNIEEEANGTLKPLVKEVKAVNVTNHMLEIRLYWAGKGTTLIPSRGNYGPLISAISLCHSQELLCGAERTKHHTNHLLYFGVSGAVVIITLLALGLYAQKRCRAERNRRERDMRAQGLQTVWFTWRQLQAATNNFDQANKLGEGGFGCLFDVYVQGELVLRDFNIKEEANGTLKPLVKEVKAVNVTNHMLEIRLYWAGKGTALIPKRGNYGPLISAISLCHSLEQRCGVEKTKHQTNYPLIFGATGALVTIILLALAIYAQRRCRGDNNTRERELRAQGLQTVCFTWRQLQAATNNFDQANKLGEGGFGSVFKGELLDGTIIAVKQLSSKSCQGNREFVNEIGMISGLNHPNLVKLYGSCVEKNQLMLVYEYMENNSLALALFGKSSLKLDWAARQKICVGIARGIEFLHEGSTIRMVHRDIKTPNVLLDTDLNAKISDFGLARLHENENTHISTKIAGTIGYMAPEYALQGHLTEKAAADVYSFGVVAMEIVSGKSNTKQKGSAEHVSLINWALTLEQRGDIMEIVDPMLEGEFNSKEAVRMIKVALVCTNTNPSLRPLMSEAVQMLEGKMQITQVLSDPAAYGHDLNFSKLMERTREASSMSGYDLYPQNSESTTLTSTTLNSTVEFSSSSL